MDQVINHKYKAMFEKVKKFAHDKLGWGFPTQMEEEDSFQPTYHCRYCNHALAQDSTGAWFHLSRTTDEPSNLSSETKKYTVAEVFSSLSFGEADSDGDFDGFIHIISDLNGEEVKIALSKIQMIQVSYGAGLKDERKRWEEQIAPAIEGNATREERERIVEKIKELKEMSQTKEVASVLDEVLTQI